MSMTDLRHEGKGQSRAQITAEVRERERKAVELARIGHDYADIASELGYADESGARLAVKRALSRVGAAEVETFRALESSRLLGSLRDLHEMLEHGNFALAQFGKVVKDDSGRPLVDYRARVAVLREIRQTSGELAKLHGLYAPMRVMVEEISEEAVRSEIRRINEMADRVEADLRSMGWEGDTPVIDADVVEGRELGPGV